MYARELWEKITHSLYITVVRPILSYGSLVWWKALEKQSNRKIMDKVQRLASLGVTGAVRSTPQEGLNMILHLKPMQIHTKGMAAKTALRLREAGSWQTTKSGHATVLQDVAQCSRECGAADLSIGTDYCIPTLDFQTSVPVQYPTREEWLSSMSTGTNCVAVFTDGSKMECGTGAGIYSKDLGIRRSYRLPDYCSVFQAEIFATERAAALIRDITAQPQDITIFVDSQAALKAIESRVVKSKAVLKCRKALTSIEQHRVSLCWVPGHSNIEGNEEADEMARSGSEQDLSSADSFLQPPLSDLLRKIDLYTSEATNYLWYSRQDCEVSRALWPRLDLAKTRSLLALNKSAVRLLTGVITGHCAIAPMLQRWRIPASYLCRSCNDAEEIETIFHYLCDCPGLQERRQRYLGSRFFNNLADVAEVKLSRLLEFIRSSKWFIGADSMQSGAR